MIKIQDISKSYGKNLILDNVTLNIPDNKITGLIGPSGTGKTTLIKCLMGMERYDSGIVEIDHTQMPDRKILNNIGYMAQSDSLYHDLTGIENIRFFSSMYSTKISSETISDILTLLKLEDDKNKLVSHYSGGMKRRLSLATALVNTPEYLVLDEPTVGIDPVLKLSIWNQLRNLSKNSTLLITTHIMDEAMKCDYLLLMHHKKIAVSGTPEEILNTYKVNDIDHVFLKLEADNP